MEPNRAPQEQTGYLIQTKLGYFIQVPGQLDLPVHPKDHEYARSLLEQGYDYDIDFVVRTIAIGQSELDVIDCDVAELL
jgi:hypothetical protein